MLYVCEKVGNYLETGNIDGNIVECPIFCNCGEVMWLSK